MSDDISIENYEVVNNLLLVTFTDSTEAVINIKLLRQRCPCASCEGEKDALGNLYKGPEQKLNDNKNGDGLDVSSSILRITENIFQFNSDKGLSIGENSITKVSENQFNKN